MEAKKELAVLANDKNSPLRIDAARALGVPFTLERNRPSAMKRLEGKADPDAGARIFAHLKLAGCYKCHRVDDHGADVGRYPNT